ncbi:MAG TPA: hypothetical protein VKA48_09515 [Gammaproteobacteria bacterium]|nr:hypothetical protein [Gammaproteobacteria bacterium]
MELLHIFRTREAATEEVEALLEAMSGPHSSRSFYLIDRDEDPAGFDAELFRAVAEADRVLCW